MAVLAGCGGDTGTDTPDGPLDPPTSRPTAVDVVRISLEPRIPPPASAEAPPEAGWPEPGSTVRWVGHVLNRGTDTAPDVPWAWAVDGERVDSGSAPLPPGTTTLELARPWSDEEETMTLRLHPDDGASAGDMLSVPSRGLSVGLWASRELLEWMEDGPRPFPVWARQEVAAWNRILDGFSSEIVPGGIRDRLRLDRVDTLPPGRTFPDAVDTDLVWPFHGTGDLRFLQVGSSPAVVDDQTIVLHELLHQRGITDIYAYEVQHDSPNGSLVEIRNLDGSPAAGSDHMPLLDPYLVYDPPFDHVLMGDDYRRPVRVTDHTAWGLNRVAGRRTPRWTNELGNHVNGFTTVGPPGNPYLLDVPDTLDLLVVDSAGGEPLAGAEVDVFLDTAAITYVDRYRAEPDLTVGTDAEGRVSLSLDFLQTPEHGRLSDSDVAILRVRHGNRWAYHFLPVHDLNVAWAAGARSRTERVVEVVLR